MSDIVERLRRWAKPLPGIDEATTGEMMLLDDAADEIERQREWNREIAINARAFADEAKVLRARVLLLKNALRNLVRYVENENGEADELPVDVLDDMLHHARAAIARAEGETA